MDILNLPDPPKRKVGRPSSTGLKRLQHCVYQIHYHIVFTTKYRRKVITPEILEALISQTSDIAKKWGCEVIEMNGEKDHMHILLAAPPNFNLSSLIGNIKTMTSRSIRSHFAEHVNKFYWKPFFWNPSYCVLSTGGAPIDVIKRYIESQSKLA